MIIDMGNVGIAGYYTFIVNGVEAFSTPSKNLITNFGWNRLMNLTVALSSNLQIQVGTSNTPPAVTDVALGALLATKTGADPTVHAAGTDVIGAYAGSTYSFAYAQGAVVGNVAEVGFKVANAESLTSRSLVKDAMGNPTTLTITATDQLTVQYNLRYYRSAIDVTNSVTVAGVPTTYILRTAVAGTGTTDTPDRLGGFSVGAQTVTVYGAASTFGAPGIAISGSGTATGGALATSSVVVNTGTGIITFNSPTLPTSAGNIAGGITNMNLRNHDGTAGGTGAGVLGAYGDIKANFSPAINKTSTTTLRLSFRFTITRL